MKFLLIAVVAAVGLATVYSAKLTPEEEEKIFNHWLRKHKIKVPHDEAGKKWKENIIKKIEEIEAHNEEFRQGKVSFERTLNHLSHLHHDDFKKTYHGLTEPTKKVETEPVVARSKRETIPKYWNWNDKGVVQPAENQGGCGCCYAFAATAAAESHACIYNGQCTKLSVQESMECAKLCAGGREDDVWNYSKAKGGFAKDKDHPFNEGNQITKCDSDIKNNPRVSNTIVADYKYMPNDTYTIMHNLYKKGPMFIGLKAYGNLQDYHTGVYDKTEGTFGWHAILLIGYGTTSAGKDYWIVKNSWGDSWGQGGIGKILRGVDFCSMESTDIAYPIMKPKAKA